MLYVFTTLINESKNSASAMVQGGSVYPNLSLEKNTWILAIKIMNKNVTSLNTK